MASTSNYGWETPDDTDYVYQGAAAARTTANAIDATLDTLAQKWVSYVADTSASITVTSGARTALFSSPSFTPQADRVYLISYGIGFLRKTTTVGEILVTLRANSAAGASIDASRHEGVAINNNTTFSKTAIVYGISGAFTPVLCVESGSGGFAASNSGAIPGFIVITDIGSI